MSKDTNLWRIEVATTGTTVNAFEEALDPFCGAISWYATDNEQEWRIEGFTEKKPDPESLAQAMSAVAEALSVIVPEVSVVPVAPRDWVADSLRMFPPTDAGRYFIYGTHYVTPPPVGRIGICLNPGRAFGSGEHATTKGCLLAFDELARSLRFSNVLDMGCGSGILSIAMAKTWTAQVTAADVDVNCVLVSKNNIHNNAAARQVRVVRSNGYASPVIAANGPYGLIVSNILANPLCRFAVDLGRHLDKGGIAVLAGFIEEDANRVRAAHQRQGLRLLRSYKIDGWVTLVLERRAASG